MFKHDYSKLLDNIKEALVSDLYSSFAIIGLTPIAYDLVGFFKSIDAYNRLLGIYTDQVNQSEPKTLYRNIKQLSLDAPDNVIIASDVDKEQLLELAVPYLLPKVNVIIGGYSHFNYTDEIFDEVVGTALVPSLANGYSKYSYTSLPVPPERCKIKTGRSRC